MNIQKGETMEKFVAYMIKEQPELSLLIVTLGGCALMIAICGEVFVN